MALLWLKDDEPVEVVEQTLSLGEALQKHYELTQNTLAIVESYAALAWDEALLAVVADKTQLQQFALATPIVDMVRRAPIELRAEAKPEPLINMMLRCCLLGGVITPQQWLGIDAFAAEETFYGRLPSKCSSFTACLSQS